MLTFIVFVLGLGAFIFVHECGHFFAARISGVKVEEFALGFPPNLYTKKRQGTKYKINLLPLGGYVKLLGEDETVKRKDSFSGKKVRYRLFIVTAGVIMNLLMAYFLLTVGYLIGMNPVALDARDLGGQKTEQVLVAAVDSQSPAETVGLRVGDFIDGFSTAESFAEFTNNHRGEEVTLNIERRGEIQSITVKLRAAEDMPALGVGISGQGTKVKLGLWGALGAAGREMTAFTKIIWHFLGQFLTSLFGRGQLSEQVTGPIGIYNITGQAIQLGWVYVIQFFAILSMNLGLINILPFPALDGGRALLIFIEGIVRRKVIRQEVEAILHTVGFFLLIALMVAVTYREAVYYIFN